jgi:hypothetical protein
MRMPHVILVEAAYYGILSLLTGVRFTQECCMVPDFVNTERRFVVVLRHMVIRYGDGRAPPASLTAPLATLRASLVSSAGPHPVARSSTCSLPGMSRYFCLVFR